MIWSVSTLLRRSGTPTPVWLVNASISLLRRLRGRPGDESVPRTAVAAATGTDTRWVRPPLPWRPSKLRLDVDALRSPGSRVSGFMPRHIEQPAPRHSAPASLKITSRPSSSACRRTRAEPGTTSIRVSSSTCRPSMISAASRRSSIRPLVQEPTKTVSTLISRIGVPASRAMYCSAFSAATRSWASSKSSGLGTLAAERHALAGVGAPGDERRHRRWRRGRSPRRTPRRRR